MHTSPLRDDIIQRQNLKIFLIKKSNTLVSPCCFKKYKFLTWKRYYLMLFNRLGGFTNLSVFPIMNLYKITLKHQLKPGKSTPWSGWPKKARPSEICFMKLPHPQNVMLEVSEMIKSLLAVYCNSKFHCSIGSLSSTDDYGHKTQKGLE